jgi:hypothetical protein
MHNQYIVVLLVLIMANVIVQLYLATYTGKEKSVYILNIISEVLYLFCMRFCRYATDSKTAHEAVS